ncbi:PEFG-CTERM sorting domain-containing protein [Nitrosopumilus maritimus]|uniref:Uncharacterized protein n=1 Tax=Nitrosopumilus maritimus (strain SCM1) TaxID=436308 RepID=A9A3S0_NITMS|nr:PEFG-CTERM sorting domain-containing protein [Nitrosopumilus maritimus]ABX13332.1 hypothetical protein Nmar_1436 [Nitrosopumilus maritimus SCM1]
MKTRFLIIITVFTLVLIPITTESFAEELWLDADFDIFNEQLQDDRKFRMGETVHVVGTSSFYNEETDEHFPASDTEFHVMIKNTQNDIIQESNYFSDSEGKIAFSFEILNDFSIGEYTIEMIVDKRKHLDLSFFVGHLVGDVVKIDEEFDLWMEDSEIVSSNTAHLNGILCSDFLKESNDNESIYLHPYDEEILEVESVEIRAFYTNPDGEEFMTSSNPEKKSCTNFTANLSAHVPGEWSVYVKAFWMENEILYESTSHSITYLVKESLFQGTVEKIPKPNRMQSMYLLDWSNDGKSILFSYYLQKTEDSITPYLGILSTDDYEITTLNIPTLLETDEKIRAAKFSPDGKYIHFVANEGNLFQYDIETSHVLKLTNFSEWVNFDYYHYYEEDPEKYSIVISLDRESYYDDPSEQGSILLDIGNGEENSVDNAHELISGDELHHFDISPDGKKILFHKTIESSYGWADRVLAYYTPEGNVVEIPNSQVKCGHPSKWTPDGEMIVYGVSSCGRGAPGGTLHIISTDGSYHEIILGYNNDRPDTFVISPDGLSLVYLRENNFEIMTFAKAVPEFQTVMMFVLLLSMLPIVLLRKQLMLK